MGSGPVPVSSLVAVLFICIGIGLFCGTGYVGCQQVHSAFETYPASDPDGETIQDKVYNVTNPVQISIFCLSGFMVIMIIFFLFQAFMATAAISREDFSSQSVICGGRGWTTVSVVLSYVLTILWILVFAGSFYCFLLTYMISSHEGKEYNFSMYGLKARSLNFSTEGQASVFRSIMEMAYVMFAIFFGASFLILLGMINLTMCHSANLAHVKTSKQWQRYNDRKQKDQLELNVYSNSGMMTSTSNMALSSY